jgi:peptide/nickel transport system permease protein
MLMPTLRFGSTRRAAQSRWRISRLRRHIVPGVPITVLALFVLAAIFAPLLTSYDPIDNDLINSLRPPAWVEGGGSAHLLGTDGLGRDVFARLLYGARVSFLVVVFSLAVAVVIGVGVGVVAGYFGGRVDALLMRIVDIFLALPPLLVALVFGVALGPSFRNLVLILGILIWPNIARLIRGETLVLMRRDFVGYPRAIGIPPGIILLRHIFPNILPTLLVAATLEVANVILTESALSFLGAGLPPPQPSWGVMVDDGRALIATGWWIALFPGLAILMTVLSFNALGDWLRDRFDPKTQQVLA